MNKKKLKKEIKVLRAEIDLLARQVAHFGDVITKNHCYCENYKPRTVTFKRFTPLPQIGRKDGETE